MRVVVADRAAHVRSALRLLLEQHAVRFIAELATADRLIAELEGIGADVLLIDSQLPDVHLGRLLRSVRQSFPELRIVVLSTRPEEREHVLAAGADAFVSKGDAPEKLVAVLSLSEADSA